MFASLASRVAPAAAALLLLAGTASAQDAGGMQPLPPGPQHKVLAARVGTWKATLKMYMEPGAPPMAMEGVETIRPMAGGSWFVTDFRCEQPLFEGHGFQGWEAKKGKYVGTWVDSWSFGYQMTEGPESPDGKTTTIVVSGPNMNGEIETMTMVETMVDPNHREVKAYRGPDVSGSPAMTIEYSRIAGDATPAHKLGAPAKKD